mmetsp:Transcript_44003/g.115608  ORF Transcript_44003/g.115608 Transcript_44003/m.115608 type:complete len:209 (-) Transcript_44003:649-1275(-)
MLDPQLTKPCPTVVFHRWPVQTVDCKRDAPQPAQRPRAKGGCARGEVRLRQHVEPCCVGERQKQLPEKQGRPPANQEGHRVTMQYISDSDHPSQVNHAQCIADQFPAERATGNRRSAPVAERSLGRFAAIEKWLSWLAGCLQPAQHPHGEEGHLVERVLVSRIVALADVWRPRGGHVHPIAVRGSPAVREGEHVDPVPVQYACSKPEG